MLWTAVKSLGLGKLGLVLWLGCCATQLHAGFVGSSCFFGCVSFSPDSGSGLASPFPVGSIFNPNGTTTYSYLNTFSGAIVGGKPTLGTSASESVDDPNGIPTLASGAEAISGMTYTDSVAVTGFTLGSVLTFTFDLHVDNNSPGDPLTSPTPDQTDFYDVYSGLDLLISGFDSSSNPLLIGRSEWFYSQFAPGSTDTSVVFTGSPIFSALATLDINLNLSSTVCCQGDYLSTSATDISASSDASHTLIFQSIQSQDFVGQNTGATFTSQNGADYSAVPEPATIGLLAAGLLLFGCRRLTSRS